ncbi:MAG: hypothetical protein WC492_03300 [Candidatus Micrarchaeia archaeon]
MFSKDQTYKIIVGFLPANLAPDEEGYTEISYIGKIIADSGTMLKISLEEDESLSGLARGAEVIIPISSIKAAYLQK